MIWFPFGFWNTSFSNRRLERRREMRPPMSSGIPRQEPLDYLKLLSANEKRNQNSVIQITTIVRKLQESSSIKYAICKSFTHKPDPPQAWR
jgi:hypothetical protein